MADLQCLEILGEGVARWNDWRASGEGHHRTEALPPDPTKLAKLLFSYSSASGRPASQLLLGETGFGKQHRSMTSLLDRSLKATGATRDEQLATRFDLRVRLDLSGADLAGRNLRGVNLAGVLLNRACLRGANLRGANLSEADLFGADLSRVDLTGANLMYAHIVNVNLRFARLDDCVVYGVSSWDTNLTGASQSNLAITLGAPLITVDNLDVAQFIHLLLESKGFRSVIDAVTGKVVLILGRFSGERLQVLNVLRDALRREDYIPILFDFPQSPSRDLTETISAIAHMSRFVIADLTDTRSVAQELMKIVPTLPSVPVRPLLAKGGEAYALFEHLKRYPWVQRTFVYRDEIHVAQSVRRIVAPAEKYARLHGRVRKETRKPRRKW